MFVPAIAPGVFVPVPPLDTGTSPAREMTGVVPPELASGDVAVTADTPPTPVALIVLFGHDPVMLMFEPATSAGVAVPVPPLPRATIPGREMAGVARPLEASGAVAAPAETPPAPGAAIVWFGHVPVTEIFAPATKLGVAVPLPPYATGNGSMIEIFGIAPPL